MSGSVTFKCPSCGGYLEFNPGKQRFVCPYCGRDFAESELAAPASQPEAEDRAAASDEQPAGEVHAYHCSMCGAEIVTGATTAATRCYYCHNPVVLTDRLSDDFRPDGVVPFQLDKAQAEARFTAFIRKKRWIDRRFFSKAQLEDFSGVYYPYWYGDFEGEASFEGEGTRTSVAAGSRETITTTRVYRVERAGTLSFRNLQRKALSSANRLLSDGVHPYRMDGLKPYAPGYLSGFLAERRDVEEASVREDMEQEIQGYANTLMRDGAVYDTLSGKTNFRLEDARMRCVLLPAWVLTYKSGGKGQPYYYMMNGQTGAVCGRLPIRWGKVLIAAGIIFAAVFAALCAGGALLW